MRFCYLNDLRELCSPIIIEKLAINSLGLCFFNGLVLCDSIEKLPGMNLKSNNYYDYWGSPNIASVQGWRGIINGDSLRFNLLEKLHSQREKEMPSKTSASDPTFVSSARKLFLTTRCNSDLILCSEQLMFMEKS